MFERIGEYLCWNGRRYAKIEAAPATHGGWVMLAEDMLFGPDRPLDLDRIETLAETIEENVTNVDVYLDALRDWSTEITFSCKLEEIALLHQFDALTVSLSKANTANETAAKAIEAELYE